MVDMKFWGWRDLSEEKYLEVSKDRRILNINIQCKNLNQITFLDNHSGRQPAYLEMTSQ